MTCKKSNKDFLLEFLLSLTPSGPRGFEGLIRDLLEAWTGETFRLARAGSQRGKDATSSDGTANVIAAEMKRYDQSHPLTDRDISGELWQVAEALSDLDIWILATTREIGEAEERNLRCRAETFGIEAVALDAREEGVGPLQVLCARFPDTVTAFCREVSSFPEETLRARLVEIALHPGFQVQLSALSSRLQRATIGFDSTRKRATDWLNGKLRSSQESMATFFQDIGLQDEGRAKPLQRKQISEQLWSWWNDGSHELRCSVLGEEGAGKTWATMAWLLELAQQHNSPIIVPVTSGQMPHIEDLNEVVVRTLRKRFGRTELFWSKRIERWDPAILGFPPILLIFDGLNEAPKTQWRLLLEQANADAYRGRIALLTTCRPGYWQKLYFTHPCISIQTDGYDDQELERILTQAGRHLHEVPHALHPLMRRPRYCELVLQHFDEMSEDPTIERLLYEDYRSRLEKKAIYPITTDDFCQILTALAEQYREGITLFRRHDISNLVAGVSEADPAIQEIMDGGLFVETGLSSRPFRVERRRLIHGLGMLLADHLAVAGEKTRAEHLESIGAWLEPGAEMEIKSPIVGAAIFFATITPSYPTHARQALLEYWLSRRNVSDAEEDILTAYFPECAEDVLAVADSFWEERSDNHVAEERLTWTIVSRRDHPKVKPVLIEAAKRWMSYVNIGGYPSGKNIHGDARAKNIAAIQERIGRKIHVDEELRFNRWKFKVIDDDRKLFLSHLALKVIGAGDRLPFFDSLLCWAVSRSTMGTYFEDDDVAWIMRLTDEPLWQAMEHDVETMANSGNDVLRKAANSLLWCFGTRDANTLKRGLLQGLYPKPDYIIEHEEDPCRSPFSIGREHYQECLSREDLPIKHVLWKLNEFLLDPTLQAPSAFFERLLKESHHLPIHAFHLYRMGKTAEEGEIDRVLDVSARFFPKLTGDIFRSIVQDIPNRSLEQQSYLLSFLPKISMLLREEELQISRNALSMIRSVIAKGMAENNSKHAESDGTLALHYHMSPDDVVDDILGRHKDTFDSNIFDQCNNVSPKAARHFLNYLLFPTDTKYLQRLLWLLPLVPSDFLLSEHENRLLELLFGDDIDLQCGAIRYAYCSKNEALIKAVTKAAVTFSSVTSSRILAYESAILVEHGKELPFDLLVRRLSLPYLIRAVNKRGCIQTDIDLLARILDAIISLFVGFQKNYEDELVSTVAQRERHALRTLEVAPDVMSVICEKYPDLVEKWLALVMDGSASYIHVLSGFYYSLCAELLKKDSEDGIRLWRNIKFNRGSGIVSSGVDWIVLIAFSALPQGAARIVCDELLVTASSDIELYRIVLAARKFGQNSWIIEKAELLLYSPHLWQRGKGLMLFALTNCHPDPFEVVVEGANVVDTWLETPASSMKDIYDRNQWGKHWYRRFLTIEEEDEAFCAWHLFLKCLDGRCRDWMKTLEKEYCLPGSKAAKRIKFCDMNDGQIEHAIGEREKEYANHFLTIKIRSSEWERILPYHSEIQA